MITYLCPAPKNDGWECRNPLPCSEHHIPSEHVGQATHGKTIQA